MKIDAMQRQTYIIAFITSLAAVSALAWQTSVGPASAPVFSLHISEDGAPHALSLSATGTENAFPSLINTPPTWMFSREWDAVRLTVRGVDEADEATSVRFGPNPAFIILR